MARAPKEGAEEIYKHVERWRDECLIGDGSLFWPGQNIWTLKNFEELEKHYLKNPEKSEDRFFIRLTRQLEKAPKDSVCLAIEILSICYVLPAGKKIVENIRGLADEHKIDRSKIDFEHFFQNGLTNPGIYFHQNNAFEVGYLTKICQEIKKEFSAGDIKNMLIVEKYERPSKFLDLMDKIAREDIFDFGDPKRKQIYVMKYILPHILFPDRFQRLVSENQRREIIKKYNGIFDESECEDDHDRLFAIERKLGKGAPIDLWVWERDHEESDNIERSGDLEIFMSAEKYKTIVSALEKEKNLILQGPPGVGKSFVAPRIAKELTDGDEECILRIQFHQAYSYEDFVHGYRPDGERGFSMKDGQFVQFCDQVRLSDQPHVLIIEEINRGNLSRIFGEMITLIESDKRNEKNAITLAGKQEDGEFYVPDNMYLIGTMNTADRSLALVDYALRRRFAFFDLEPAFGQSKFHNFLLQQGVEENIATRIDERMRELNGKINEDSELGSAYCVGHSYFCPYEKGQYDTIWFENVIDTKIAPLLREYCFDDKEKAEQWIGTLKKS